MRFILAWVYVTLTALPAESSRGWAQAPSDSASIAVRIDRYLTPLAATGQLSGIVLLGRGATVLYERAFGWVDRPGGRAMTVSTPSPVASISKPLTSIIITQLASQGRLALDDHLSRWLPDFPSADRITIELLMSHRAGVRHRVTQPNQEREPQTAATMFPLIASAPLLFEPGSRRVYSSMGYVVLARAAELASGKPYWRLLEDLVLQPAGTTRSSDATRLDRRDESARAYVLGPDGLIPRGQRDLSFLVGAGSLYSTPRDLFRIFQTLLAGRYGPGAQQRQLRGTLFWNGLTDGYRAYLQYDSTSRVTLAFTTNFVTGVGDLILRDLPRIAAGATMSSPDLPRPQVVALSDSARQRLTVEFEFQPEVFSRLEFLSPRAAMVGDYLLLPTSDTTFFSMVDYAEVAAIRAPDGTVGGLQWCQWAAVPTASRSLTVPFG